RSPAVVAAVAVTADAVPRLRGIVFGDGPERKGVLASLDGTPVEAPGFVPAEHVHAALRSALCMVLPSRREGYGMVVVEASASGTPSVVVREPDNAATELVEDGVNGVIAASASPQDLAAAIVRVHEAGDAMRASTCAWFAANAQRLSLASSLETVVASY